MTLLQNPKKESKKGLDDQRIKLDLLHGFGSLVSKGYKNCVVNFKL